MRTYKYKSRNAQGKIVSGDLEAETQGEAVKELRRRGLTIVEIDSKRGGRSGKSGGQSKATSGSSTKQSFFSMQIGGGGGGAASRKKVKSNDLVIFTRQLATMVSAGIPLVEAIEILEEQATNPGLRYALGEVVSDVRSGKDLSQSITRHPKIFSDIYVNMIRAGEASGQLDTVLARLADYQEDAEKLRSEIKSAMTYPVISLIMVLSITLFLLVFIIPKFEEMFISMNVELPALTEGLLATSKFLQAHMMLWVGGCIAVVVGAALYFKTPKGLYTKDWLLLKAPVFGPLFAKVAISRFARTFATLIQSGVPILGALEIVSQTCGNLIFSKAIDESSHSVRQGETLGDPLARSKVFPLMVTKMISIGEKSGALEPLLEKISEFYDQQVSATVKSLTSLIEPIMIGIMGFLVGGMVLAIFLPIFKMIGSL